MALKLDDPKLEEDEKYEVALNILGLGRDATDTEITKQYRKLSGQCHPDLNPGKASEERFKEVSRAYEFVSGINLLDEGFIEEEGIEDRIDRVLDWLENSDPYAEPAEKVASGPRVRTYTNFDEAGVKENVDVGYDVDNNTQVNLICNGRFLELKLHNKNTVVLQGRGLPPVFSDNVLQAYIFEGEATLPMCADVTLEVHKSGGYLLGSMIHNADVLTSFSVLDLGLGRGTSFRIGRHEQCEGKFKGWERKGRIFVPEGYDGKPVRRVDIEAVRTRMKIRYEE